MVLFTIRPVKRDKKGLNPGTFRSSITGFVFLCFKCIKINGKDARCASVFDQALKESLKVMNTGIGIIHHIKKNC